MNGFQADHFSALSRLRRGWRWTVLASLTLAGSGFLLVQAGWEARYAARWLWLALPLMAYPLGVLWTNLEHNHRPGETYLLPSLGVGNVLTLLRGLLLAALAGFLFLPRPQGWLAWAPGFLYLLADIADYLDGYLARLTHHATYLGERLDMSFDGLGVLIAAGLAVLYGQAPAWYLAVGLARPLYLGGLWLRRRLGKPVYSLSPDPIRRTLAGVQMGFIAIILLPVFSSTTTRPAALFFALPFLTGFLRDFFTAGGMQMHSVSARQKRLMGWLPVGFRVSVALLNAWVTNQQGSTITTASTGEGAIVMLASGVALMILLGAAGRTAAIGGMILAGLSQAGEPLSIVQAGLLAAYATLFFLGTGRFSLWTPEERLIYTRPGERRGSG